MDKNANIPLWLRSLNAIMLTPLIAWPFLFMRAGDLVDSNMEEHAGFIFMAMLCYPVILIGNFFLCKKFYQKGYSRFAIATSVSLAICMGLFVCRFFGES